MCTDVRCDKIYKQSCEICTDVTCDKSFEQACLKIPTDVTCDKNFEQAYKFYTDFNVVRRKFSLDL